LNKYEIKKPGRRVLLSLTVMCLFLILFCSQIAMAESSTSLTIKKLASDGETVLAEKTVDYQWLMDTDNISVLGDGTTHYYHQGPVFVDDQYEATEEKLRWNAKEDTNIEDKDMGALKGNNLKDLCDLVGGMSKGDTIKIKASDGLSKTFAYKNVYQYSKKEGPMVICWYKDGLYPDSGYTEGMRLVWFADTSNNPWGMHVFGNWDWHEAADAKYWYYYESSNEEYPTTTGLSVQNVSELTIYSTQAAIDSSAQQTSSQQTSAPQSKQTTSAPVANFTTDIFSGNAPFTVKFMDKSSNSPSSWAWDFDNDGKTDSSAQNPSYSYENPGTYSVSLSVSNASGSDKEIKSDYIKVDLAASSEVSAEAPIEATPGDSSKPVENNFALSHYLPLIIILILAICIGVYLIIRRQKRDK